MRQTFMPILAVSIGVALAANVYPQPTEPSWHLRLSTAEKTYIVLPDGTDQRKVQHVAPSRGQLSPDGTRRLAVDFVGFRWIATISDADGKNAKKLTEITSGAQSVSWSPDGKRIAFNSYRGGKCQIYTIDPDGTNVRQITHEPMGALQFEYGTGGLLAFLALRRESGKAPPSDLIVVDDNQTSKIAENSWISAFAWSPDGKMIAFSKEGSLVFHELESGKTEDVVFKNIDAHLFYHAASRMNWRPDGQALTCTIEFLGGRKEGTRIFGDDEIFVIPRDGQPTWFTPSEKMDRVEWVLSK